MTLPDAALLERSFLPIIGILVAGRAFLDNNCYTGTAPPELVICKHRNASNV